MRALFHHVGIVCLLEWKTRRRPYPSLSLVVGESWDRDGSVRTFAKLMAPFLAPATARVERRLDRANILDKLLLSFVDGRGGVRGAIRLPMAEGWWSVLLAEAVVYGRGSKLGSETCRPVLIRSTNQKRGGTQQDLWIIVSYLGSSD